MRCCDLDGVVRFSDRAAIYARGRPSYPVAAINCVIADVADGVVVDVGAGTGIASRLLAERGLRTVGIDPGLDMLLAGEAVPSLLRAGGRAEFLPVRTGVAQIVTAFNAFHWFQPDAFFEEAHRALDRNGRLALVWNDWDHSDPFTAEFVTLMRSAAVDYPPEDRDSEVAPLYSTARFGPVERYRFDNVHILDEEGLRHRLQSMSYVPRHGDGWTVLASQLASLFRRYAATDGTVRHRYTTSVFLAARV